MKKIITVIMLVIAITLCGACTSPQEFDDIKTQTAALEKLISSQQELIEGLQNKLNGNDQNAALTQEKIEELQKSIDKLQKQNDLYKAQLRNLTGKSIVFFAEKPIYNCDYMRRIAIFGNVPGYSNTPFLDFLNYCENKRPFGEKKICVFRPDDYEDEGWEMPLSGRERYYTIYQNDETIMFHMEMKIYDEIFGCGYVKEEDLPNEENLSENENYNINLHFDFIPFDSQEIKEIDYYSLRLNFGEYKNWDSRNTGIGYFNIYIEDICIGTCSYGFYCQITETGVKDYIYKHLEIL